MMEAHEIAQLFPPMEGPELKELEEDIRERGVEDPITLFEGKVLDGVHRYMLGSAHGKHVPSRQLPEGADPIAFCIARNLKRRHLNPSQRALLAERLADHRRPGRKGERAARTRREAAEEVGGCSERAIARARTVRNGCDEEVVRAVRDGKVTLSDADNVREEPPERQREAVARVENGEAKSLVEAMEKAEHDARRKEARRKDVAADTTDEDEGPDIAMPAVARIHRAREVLGGIDIDPASSARVNAVVAARRWYAPGDTADDWTGSVWLRADDIEPESDAESAQAVLDALGAGTVSRALIETYATLSSAWAQRALAGCRRLAIGAGQDEPSAMLLGEDADTAAFDEAYAGTGVVFTRRETQR